MEASPNVVDVGGGGEQRGGGNDGEGRRRSVYREQRHGNLPGPRATTPVWAHLYFEPDGTAQAANLDVPVSRSVSVADPPLRRATPARAPSSWNQRKERNRVIVLIVKNFEGKMM